jgi:hypothetical protein
VPHPAGHINRLAARGYLGGRFFEPFPCRKTDRPGSKSYKAIEQLMLFCQMKKCKTGHWLAALFSKGIAIEPVWAA